MKPQLMLPTAHDPSESEILGAVVTAIDPLSDPRWPGFIAKHPRSTVFHTREWLEALRRTHGYQPIAYTTSSPNKILSNALVFCRVDSWLTGRRLVSLPFTDHCEPLLHNPADLLAILSEVERRLPEERWRYIEMRPRYAYPAITSLSQTTYNYAFHQIDLTPSIDTLFNNLHTGSVQRKIYRAKRENLTYQAGRSDDLLIDFYRLFLLTRRRHRLPPHPFRWFRNLVSFMGKDLSIRVAFKDDRAIAAILTLNHKQTVTYKYGCSDLRFNNLGGTHLLFWQCIQQAKADGLSAFDLGRSDLENTGLITFKNRWGGAQSLLSYSRYATSAEAMHPLIEDRNRWTLRLTKRLIASAPNPIFSAIGSIFYKHVG